jgi:hypothetical protein
MCARICTHVRNETKNDLSKDFSTVKGTGTVKMSKSLQAIMMMMMMMMIYAHNELHTVT